MDIQLQKMVSTDPYLNKLGLDLKNSDMPVIDFADFLVESGMFSSREELSEYIKRTSVPYVEGSGDFYPNGSIHSETYEEYCKRMERNAQNSDRSNIAVINIPDYEYYTGNEGYTSCVQGDPSDPMIAAQNRAVNYGMRYKSSCFDFTNQNDYLALTKSADYTGMTAAEKYRAIYEKYQHCYGRNFLDALAINYTAPMQNDPYTELCEKFETEIANVCGLSGEYSERAEQLRQLRREALYGEKASKEEVRQMITEKYPPMGEITFRDFYKMTNEMEMCGVGGHVNNWIGEIFSSVGGYYSNGSGGYDLRENMMDTKVTFDHLRFMQKSYNGRLSSGISMHPDFGTVLNELMAAYRSSSANERGRSAISNSLLEEMRSRSVGVMSNTPYAEKSEDKSAQSINASELPVADFSQKQPYSTGDSKKDYLISIGGKYRKSCWDDAHWTELDALTKAADYTGMSDAEKYRAIYEKYQYCFGENFLDTEAIGFSRPPASEDGCHLTVLKFYDELKENFGSRTKSMEIRCEALYGTTDKYEVRQAIIDKYTDGRNITLGNFYKMANEMYECGVGGDIMNWVDESMDWVAAKEYGAETIWEYLDYLKNCAVGVNDPSTIKYQRLDQNVSGEFIEQLKYFAFTGKGKFGDAMSQILNSIDVETSSSGSRSRGAVSNSLLEEMRSRSVGVRASV